MMIYIFIMNPSSSLGDISLANVLEGNIGHVCKYKMSRSQPCANCLVSWKNLHSPPDHTSESTSTPPNPQGLQPVSSTQKQCLYSSVLPSCDSYSYWTENDELGKLCFASFSESGKWWQEIHLIVCKCVYWEGVMFSCVVWTYAPMWKRKTKSKVLSVLCHSVFCMWRLRGHQWGHTELASLLGSFFLPAIFTDNWGIQIHVGKSSR